jgi:hypothetical protein
MRDGSHPQQGDPFVRENLCLLEHSLGSLFVPSGGYLYFHSNHRTREHSFARTVFLTERRCVGPIDRCARSGDGCRIALGSSIAEHDEAGARASAASLAPVAKASTKGGVGEFVAAYASRWLADRVGRVQSVADDRARMRLHVLPLLGHVSVLSLPRDAVERLRDEVDRKIEKGDGL